MVEVGILTDEERIELLEGVLAPMTPIGDLHAGCVNRLNDLLSRRLGERALVIVQNPNTGEVLAMASAPSLDANDYVKSRAQARVNRGVSWVYEPGSTFKVVTVSAEAVPTNPRPTWTMRKQRAIQFHLRKLLDISAGISRSGMLFMWGRAIRGLTRKR